MSSISVVRRIHVGGVPIDAVTTAEALGAIARLVEQGSGGTVFTPNADHIVLANQNLALFRAYATVDLSLPDGMSVVWASRMLGTPVPEKVSGSDLVFPLMTLAEAMGWRVYLLGGAPGVAARAALRLRARHAHLRVVGASAPSIDPDATESWSSPIEEVRRARPDLVLVAFGAPKQELWIHHAAEALRPAVLLGVGASLDFIAGTARRAPRWASAVGLEWLHRLIHEPRRLWRRYLLRDPSFVAIVLTQLVQARRAAPRGALRS